MKAEYINPFVLASFSVLDMVLGSRPVKGDLAVRAGAVTGHQCNVVCGVTGHIQGHVAYGMSLDTADRIASTMMGETLTGFEQLAASAIGELANMISGNAMLHLSEAGWVCDITPPSIIQGTQVSVSPIAVPSVMIPITMEQGEICITIGLQSRN